MIALWALSTFGYLEWGTMSFSSWNFLHRLDRHLELATPPMILATAWGLARLSRLRRGAWVTSLAAAALAVTSTSTIRARHRETLGHLSLMQPIHSVLEVFHPADVFMDTQTNAYQQFLDRYESRGRTYHDVANLQSELADDSMVIVHSDTPSKLPSNVLDPLGRAVSWQVAATLHTRDTRGNVKTVQAFRAVVPPLESMDFKESASVEAHVRRLRPDGLAKDARLLFGWEGVVDGVEQIDLGGPSVSTRHLAFQPPGGVVWRSYAPVAPTNGWRYRS